MDNPNENIDRHKVAACYMIAIATTRPMRLKKFRDETVPLAINETLAITVGLSIVRAFIITAVEKRKEMKTIEESKANEILQKFDKGLAIPEGDLVNHGDYIENFAKELSFVSSGEGSYILPLAHELFLLEVLTRIKDE